METIGILQRAADAKTQTKFAEAKEALALANADAVVEKIVNGNNEFLANVISKLRAEGYTVEQEVQTGTTKQIVILDGETEISDNEIISLEKGATKVLNVDVQSVSSNGQALPYYILVDGKYHKILEDEKGNLSLEEKETSENTVKGTTDNSATYALNVVSSDAGSTNATVTLNNGTLTIVGNEKTTEDITVTIKYANTQNAGDVKATKSIKISIPKGAIDYGEKTESNIAVGDDLTIGSENFRVLSKSANQIIAIPFYNITLDETNPVQSGTAGNSYFADTSFTADSPRLDMSDESIIIQKYISAYSNKLHSLDSKVSARVVYTPDISGYTSNASYYNILNPTSTGSYWLGSKGRDGGNVAYITAEGHYQNNGYIRAGISRAAKGVRPLVIIDLS